MSDQPQIPSDAERFNLSDFVLGYLEGEGSIVMPPEFGIYEVLMPDEVAESLTLDEHARIAFGKPTEGAKNANQEDLLQLGVSHPLVGNIAERLTSHPANVRTYIRGVRADKRGLAELARTHLGLANARIDEIPKTQEEGAQHHYLLCNFKVTLLSEEKQEELVAVVIDVQAGSIVEDETVLERLAILDVESAYEGLPMAPLRWNLAKTQSAKPQQPNGALANNPVANAPLTAETMQALLPRAEEAIKKQLEEQVLGQAARMERHLDLDLARINDYYDEMATDLQKRQSRLDDDDERRQGFDEKLTMLEAERGAKLNDARNRYQLRVEMELVNGLLATQAKVTLPVSISNRTAEITRTVVWDPLLHQLEPLICDVCSQPGEDLHLCTEGHLAHESCLSPQCVDCKREFCQLCAEQMTECVVCQRSVCRPSLIKCSTCGRGTCREHQQLCHAADGKPAVLAEATPSANADAAADSSPSVQPAPAVHSEANLLTHIRDGTAPTKGRANSASSRSASTRNASTRTTKKQPKPKTPTKPIAKGVRIDVEVHETAPVIVAFVMKSTKRVLAKRTIDLSPDGIQVSCTCEKEPCPSDGYVYRPRAVGALTEQIGEHLRKLRQEYLVPPKKVKFYYKRFGQVHEEKRLVLPAVWRDPKLLAEAEEGFDNLNP
ncbi:MAG: hypothetical protein AAF702_26595 [Chloroflexota bacterium]